VRKEIQRRPTGSEIRPERLQAPAERPRSRRTAEDRKISDVKKPANLERPGEQGKNFVTDIALAKHASSSEEPGAGELNRLKKDHRKEPRGERDEGTHRPSIEKKGPGRTRVQTVLA